MLVRQCDTDHDCAVGACMNVSGVGTCVEASMGRRVCTLLAQAWVGLCMALCVRRSWSCCQAKQKAPMQLHRCVSARVYCVSCSASCALMRSTMASKEQRSIMMCVCMCMERAVHIHMHAFIIDVSMITEMSQIRIPPYDKLAY